MILLQVAEEVDDEEVARPPIKKRKVVGVARFIGLDNLEPSDTSEEVRQPKVDRYLARP